MLLKYMNNWKDKITRQCRNAFQIFHSGITLFQLREFQPTPILNVSVRQY